MPEVAPKIGRVEIQTEPPHLRLITSPLDTEPAAPQSRICGPEYWAQFADKKAAKKDAWQANFVKYNAHQYAANRRRAVVENAAEAIGKIVTLEFKDGTRGEGVCKGLEHMGNRAPSLDCNKVILASPELDEPQNILLIKSLEVSPDQELPFIWQGDNT